ncbi:MAG: 2OG-Fe(II) oxygenase family protein, partial [Hyphomicrobiaceae bacterium]
GHIHANSIISGTIYVDVPEGASAIRFEDPRLAMMIAAPPRKTEAALHNQQFVSFEPAPGDVLLWESWLRHEVPVNMAAEDRISASFNAVLT